MLFRSNNLQDLERLLGNARGQAYVFTEAVFSMTGTHAPLADIIALCNNYGACLLVDEAHSLGLYGPQGKGLLAQHGLATQVPVRVYPLGKAAGAAGALVVGPRLLIDYLVNTARAFIYTTAPLPVQAWLAYTQLQAMAAADVARGQLWALAAHAQQHFTKSAEATPGIAPSMLHNYAKSAILPIAPASGHAAWPSLLSACAQAKLWVRPIRTPTVPPGEECLRITLHHTNTIAELDTLLGLGVECIKY